MHKRNRHLVDNSSVCVCYLNKENGGTAYTVDYAGKKGLEIINLVKSCSPFSAAKWQRQKSRQSRGQRGDFLRSKKYYSALDGLDSRNGIERDCFQRGDVLYLVLSAKTEGGLRCRIDKFQSILKAHWL